MTKKIAIYTAIIGQYDHWEEPHIINSSFDHYLFTDQDITSKYYKVIRVKSKQRSVRLAREIKILAYKYLPDYDITIWHDANLVITKDLSQLTEVLSFDMIMLRHPKRNCIYTEADACINLSKDNATIIQLQTGRYKQEKYPENNGLVATGLIVRKNTYKVNKLCNAWYTELKNGSFRDQLSFNYVLAKNPLLVKKLSFDTIHHYFKYRHHAKKIIHC